jgi:hypothetical protein
MVPEGLRLPPHALQLIAKALGRSSGAAPWAFFREEAKR